MNTEIVDLMDLCELHKSSQTDIRNKLILEEIFAVCTNDDFLQTISETRTLFGKKYNISLPFDITFSDELDSVGSLRKTIYESKDWAWYQSVLQDIREKHSLNGDAWSFDPFTPESINSGVESNTYSLEDYYGSETYDGKRSPTKSEIKRDARSDFFNDAFVGQLSSLESILLVNNPISKRSFWGIPHNDRGGTLSIGKDIYDVNNWIIEGRFYLHSTKQDMIRVIEREYDSINAKRKRMFGIEAKKAVPKQDLVKIFEVYKLNTQGETPIAISNILENKKRENDPNAETMIDEVKKILERIKKESLKYNSKYKDN